MPPARLRMVDLPQPEGPTTTTNSPGRHSRVTFSTAERVVFWKRLEMPRRERLPRPLLVRRGAVSGCGAESNDIAKHITTFPIGLLEDRFVGPASLRSPAQPDL